ncbi:MAG TPA: inosine/xanthosine triphosphatase [Candidatus Saccharimonadales bacterium]|nr:inosine/xanthosine triphosphatase [Candidatus Saccharimonadales bacterium]
MTRGEKLQIAVGTKNQAKLQAVEQVFAKAFGDTVVTGYDVASGVAEQPLTDEESITGAVNRAKAALGQAATAHYGVGLEGNVVTLADKMFLHGWVAVVDRTDQVGLGHSGGIELPDAIRSRLDAGEELGPVLLDILGSEDNTIRQTIGANGVFSGGLYDRTQEFVDAVSCALAKFVKPDLYR